MCNQCTEDPRDELAHGLRALEGLRDLFCEAAAHGKRQYEVLGCDGVAELVCMVESRLQAAGERLQNYVPREHPLAVV